MTANCTITFRAERTPRRRVALLTQLDGYAKVRGLALPSEGPLGEGLLE